METYALEKELKQFISAEKIARLHIFLVRFKVQIFKEPSSSVRNFKSVWIRRFKTSYKEIKDVELNEKSPLLPDGQFFQAFFDEMPKADECTATKSMTKKVLYINHQNAHDNDLEWFVGGEDLSSTLMKYRNNAIEIALNNEAMTDKHLMLLNYIFFFDKANTTINELGMLDKLVDIKRQLNRSYGYSAIDHNLSMLCYRLVQVCVGYDQDEDIEEVLLEERLKAKKEKDQDKTLLLSLFEVYYEKMKRINFTTEQSYVDYVLSPLFEHFFDSIHGTEHHSAKGHLESLPDQPSLLLPLGSTATSVDSTSAEKASTSTSTASASTAKRRRFSSNCTWLSLQPDYILKVVFSGQKFDLLIAEMKKPEARITQLVGDEAKLANLMKIMINRLAVKNIPSPTVCGIIDDGMFTKTFKMTIKSKGKYDFVQLACFQSIRCIDDLARLPNVVNYMKQLKNIVLYMQEVIRMTILGESLPGPQSLSLVPLEWLRPSFEYPVAEPAVKKQK